jgi:glycine dehydrogenase subunit 1
MSYFPHTPEDRQEMLAQIGVDSIEDLLKTIPNELRLAEPLAVGEQLSEVELTAHLETLADQNTNSAQLASFLGGGVYDHYVPAVVDFLSSRSEFYTAYTPYQPEVAQGTLQATYEFQSLICRLTEMDVANASLYDGASATAEAALVALASTRRKQIIISSTVHPRYRDVLATYTQGRDVAIDCAPEVDGVTEMEEMTGLISDQTACVIVQSPNFFGQLEDVSVIERAIHQVGGLLINVFYPIALGICLTPGEAGADLAVGEGQPLGNPPSYGGPLLGLLAAKKEFVRRIPGRMIGRTVDEKGRPGYVMTLQTREQHIRREKATSNICTAQALLATRAAIYTALLGRRGFRVLAEVCTRRAHYLAEKIAAIKGFSLKYPGPFFNEFVVSCPISANRIIEYSSERGIMPGIGLAQYFPDRDFDLLVCVTEKHSPAQLDRFAEILSQVAQESV